MIDELNTKADAYEVSHPFFIKQVLRSVIFLDP